MNTHTVSSASTPLAFSERERRCLMATPRIGAGVIARLESLGYASMASIRKAGLDAVIAAVCDATGGPAWGNRRRALARALSELERR